jgi:hypothetical protein
MRRTACLVLVALMATVGCATDSVRLPTMGIPGFPGAQPSDEEQIALILDEVQQGMESRRIYRVLSHVSRGYQDDEGRNYEGLSAHLNDLFERYRNIRIRRARPIVQVQGNRAQAVETFGTSADPVDANRDLAIRLQGQVTVYFEKIGDRWFIREWGRML